jgi:hypothetical protein
VLPPLWDRDTYDRILTTLKARWHGPKVRTTYQDYLLSGLAYDEECGHGIAVSRSRLPDGHFWMKCMQRTVRGREARHLRADVAEQEVDEIIAGIRFDDMELIAQVEVELGRRIRETAEAVETFRPNPEIAALRQAVAALERVNSDMTGIRAELLARVEELRALDEAHRELLTRPVVEFRAAMAQLAAWVSVWAEADVKRKNRMLREAEVQVWLGKLPGENRKPAHVRRITSANPVFNVALVAGLATFNSRYANQRALWSGNVEILVALGENAPVAAPVLGLPAGALGFLVLLPNNRGFRDPPDRDGGPWWTTGQVASAIGRSGWYVRDLVARGLLVGTKVDCGSMRYLLVNDTDLKRYLSDPPKTGRRPHAGQASPAMISWLRETLRSCPVTKTELSRSAGVSTGSLLAMSRGCPTISNRVAIRAARALLVLLPSAVGESLLAVALARSSSVRVELKALRSRTADGPMAAPGP